jgi:hypothetical protein
MLNCGWMILECARWGSLFLFWNKLKLKLLIFLLQKYIEQLLIIELLITHFFQSVLIVHVAIRGINPISYQ